MANQTNRTVSLSDDNSRMDYESAEFITLTTRPSKDAASGPIPDVLGQTWIRKSDIRKIWSDGRGTGTTVYHFTGDRLDSEVVMESPAYIAAVLDGREEPCPVWAEFVGAVPPAFKFSAVARYLAIGRGKLAQTIEDRETAREGMRDGR